MEPRKRIIVALDVDAVDKARRLVEELSPHVGLFKVGLEFVYSALAELFLADEAGSREKLKELRDFLGSMQGKLFLDAKLKDIPNTVAGASRAIARLGVGMFNVHCLGGGKMMAESFKAAAEAVKSLAGHEGAPVPRILGVTVLTSLSYDDLRELGVMPDMHFMLIEAAEKDRRERLEKLVVRLALAAKSAGLDGVIASPKEIGVIRAACGPGFLIVTPGIRPEWAAAGDQKRVMTPGEAVAAGADYLVIGRPITKPPAEIGSPAEAAKRIAEEIAEPAPKGGI